MSVWTVTFIIVLVIGAVGACCGITARKPKNRH